MHLRGRSALLAALAWLGAGCDGPLEPPAEAATAAPSRPHLLLLVLDTVRADRLGFYGGARDTTPRLDAFAARSRVFERAISSSNWTLPSHASIFTGLHPSAHGAIGSEGWLPDRFETLAERLAGAGYETLLFSANPFVSEQHNLAQGFEVREHPWRDPWRDRVAAHMQARDYPGEVQRSRFVPFKDAGGVIRDGFLDWLRGRTEPERPFFAVLNLMEAHRPWYVTRAERAAFLEPALVEHSIAMDHRYATRHAFNFGYGGYGARDLEALGGLYDAALRQLDEIVGALLAELERDGLLGRTLVAITSDHGEHLGDHDLLGHEYSLYEGLVRVPLLIHHPPLFAPGRVAEPVQTLDLFPTLLAAAGLEPGPAGAGRSLLAPDPGRALVSEYLEPKRKPLDAVAKRHPDLDRARWLRPLRAVEVDGDKLVWARGGEVRLFAVRQDPEERRDQAAARAERAAALLLRLPPWSGAGSRREGPLDDAARRLLEAIGYLDEPAD